MRGGLSNRVYVVTRYRDLGNGMIEALEKFDVTEEFEILVVERTKPVGSWETDSTAGEKS
jgi:hypothetical protein